MANSKRDLLNVLIRSSNKLDNSEDPWQRRVEEAEKHNMDLTLMPKEEEQEDIKSKMSKSNVSEIDQQMQDLGDIDSQVGGSDEEDEKFEIGTAALIFGSVTAIAGGFAYMVANKST